MSEREEVDVLADEIFSSIQAAQGQAFINDGWSGAETKAEFFEWLRTRQRWHDRAGQIFRDFFKKHGDEHRAALQKAKPLRHQSRARSWRTGYADGVERDGAIHALREMLKAYDAGALQMTSAG